MDERPYRRRRRSPGLVWPVVLITVGVLVLLSQQGLLHVSFLELWRLWPVLLILVGLEILVARGSVGARIIGLLLTVAVMAGVVVLLVAAPGVLTPSPTAGSMQISEPLDSVDRADLQVAFGAGQLNISQLTDSASLVEGTLQLATANKPDWTISRSSDLATMTLGYKEGQTFSGFAGGDNWNLQLSPKVSFSLNVNSGAGEVLLDLTGLTISDLKVEGGASQTTVTFPASGDFSADLNGGVGGLTIEIPPAMAARLRIDRGLSFLNLPSRFSKQGQYYETGDWATNRNRVDVHLTMGVGALTVREP